ncbi:sensor histidine kinase [Actinosynnema sp. NPDC051121]
MVERYARAPLRGFALAALAVLGPPTLLVAFAGTLSGLLSAAVLARRPVELTRSLAGRWCGVDIPSPYQPRPAPPQADALGYYRLGDQLYRSPALPRFQRTLNWLVQDPATRRDALWLLVSPLVAAVTALVPGALLVAGAVLALAAPAWPGVPLAVAAVVAGFAVGPGAVRLHGRCAELLLGPIRSHPGRRGAWTRLRGRLVALAELALGVLLAVPDLLLALLVVLCLVPGAGWPLPAAQRVVRPYLAWRRGMLARRAGREIPEPYLPPPEPPEPRRDGLYLVGRTLVRSPRPVVRLLRYRWVLRDKATWRDLLWLAAQPVANLPGAVVVAATCCAAAALVWPWVWWVPTRSWLDYDPAFGWRAVTGVTGWPTGAPPLTGLVVGVLVTAGGVLVAPWLLRWHLRLGVALLAPTEAALLARRVRELADARTDANQVQVAELRRIEQDLHDGVQAGLVAIGMQLDAVEHLVDRDPAQAKEMIAKARQGLAGTLVELRAVIRDIHPPVLAERGLGDAVRALALDSPLDVTTEVELPGRAEAAVESAVYFALRELLTNVAKHSGARRAWLRLWFRDGAIHAEVGDNGVGGAEPGAGSGLRGLRRRLAAFDGALAVDSPAGGPTVVALRVPCESWRQE